MIEIMVVVSIISILAAVLYMNFGDARAKARDDVRLNTLKEMQIALTLYKSQYGRYPEQGCGGTSKWTGPGPHSASWGNNTDCPEYIVGLAPDFISALPLDPRREDEDNVGYIYQTNASGSAYKLLSHEAVEVDMTEDYNHPFSRCPAAVTSGSGYCGTTPQAATYGVYSFGAEDW